MAEIGNPKRFDRRVGVVIDRGVDRDEIIVAIVLKGAAGKVDDGLHVRPRCGCLVEKVAKGRAQGLAVEVARPDNVEPSRLQRLGDETGVIGGCRQSRVPIGGVPDDQGDARVRRGLLRLSGGSREGCDNEQDENRGEKGPHAHLSTVQSLQRKAGPHRCLRLTKHKMEPTRISLLASPSTQMVWRPYGQ